MNGLQSRIGDIRTQQQALQERLAPVLEKRRTVEQLFLELDTRQSDLGRTLAEIASGDDAVELDIRLKELMDFIRQSHARCDEIETASKTIANLKDDYIGVQNRLAPFGADDGGVTSRIRDLNDDGEKLTAAINAIQLTPEGALGDRMQRLADNKRRLEEGLAHLGTQFSKLATLRRDIDGLFANFDRTLDTVTNGSGANGPHDVDSRVQELWDFIKQTQAHLDDIERRMVDFGQLKTRLGDLQTRLVPLEDKNRGVLNVIEQLRDTRDKLVSKIRHIEQDDDGDLTERLRKFTETKRELEERVTALAEQFTKLATIRNDIAGLFEKLSTAINTSSS